MMPTSGVWVLGLLHTWITPVWLLSIGVALGVAVLGVGFCVLWVVSRRLAEIASTSVREGILLPIFYLAIGLTGFAALAPVLVSGLPYRPLLSAVSRISAVGPADYEIEVPALTRDFPLKTFDVRLAELRAFTADSDQTVSIVTNIQTNIGQFLNVKVMPDNGVSWVKPPAQERDETPRETMTMWSATNVGDSPAKLRIHAVTDMEFPEMRVVTGMAISLIALVLVYLTVRLLAPKLSAIALTTGKESMSQPLFYVVLALGSFALVAFIYIPYNTFGEDVKMLKDSGLTLIMVLSIIVAVWSASVSVSEEVEGRTALTVLSKPVQRRTFILGKFLGILGPVVVLFVVLGFLFLITVSYKVVYDSREVAKTEPTWQLCYMEMIRTRAGPGAGVFGDRGSGVDQRGPFHAAADAGQPDRVRQRLRAGPPGADAGQFVDRQVRDRALRGPVHRHGLARARSLQHPSRRGRRSRRAAGISRPGALVLHPVQFDRHAARPGHVRRPRFGVALHSRMLPVFSGPKARPCLRQGLRRRLRQVGPLAHKVAASNAGGTDNLLSVLRSNKRRLRGAGRNSLPPLVPLGPRQQAEAVRELPHTNPTR